MSSERRVFERPPSLLPAWLRAVGATTKKPSAGVVLPRLDSELWPQPIDAERLRRYRRLCGFAQTPWLPATYPQVLAGPLHIHMLTDPQFPLPAAGIVHVGNRIEQRRRIGQDEPLHFACHVEGGEHGDKGLTFRVITSATVHGEPVWYSEMAILSRSVRGGGSSADSQRTGAGGRSDRRRDETETTGQPLRSVLLRVPEDTGRRYAALAGDFNPIHLHAAPARLFGFPRAIAHGMWSLARCLAECGDDFAQEAVTIDCQFRRPVPLPATALLSVVRDGDDVRFSLASKDARKVHLQTTLSPLAPL
jgi:acyl dehydratase